MKGDDCGANGGELIRRGVERVVADELEDRPVIRVRAALGGDVDLRHFAPELGRVDAGLHLEFLDAVDRGQEGIRIEVDVLIDDPVERVLVVFAALTGDREILRGSVATLPAGGAATAAAGPVRAHVRAQRHEIDEVATVERQLQDLLDSR